VKLLENINNTNPWPELSKSYGKNIIPAYADQTVIKWGLMKEVGDTLLYQNEQGEDLYIVIAGGLQASIFQGSIIIANNHFVKHFPSISGSKTMLIDAENSKKTSEILARYLKNYGIELTPTSERLAQFYSVTNTYLTVFMFLGGLGVIIGTLGLGIVLFRNILERKSEIALLLSVGYTKSKIIRLIFTENIMLLSIGVLIGTFSALIGILPSLLTESYSIPGLFILYIVAAIFISGILWIYLPIRKAFQLNLISSLRNE
jgi:ABC-type antimicrobial peptide transport system permease subunit